MNQLVYSLGFVLLIPLICAFWVEGLELIASMLVWPALKWFGLGLVISVLFGALTNGAIARFIKVAVHELAHASVGSPVTGGVKYMEAKSEGRSRTEFRSGCNPIWPFVLLAPYYLPLLTIPFLLVEPFAAYVSATAKIVVDLLIGLTLGFHYVLTAEQFSFRQTDLQAAGFLVAIGLTFTMLLIWLVIILAVVLDQYANILALFVNAFAQAPEYYRTFSAWLQGLWAGLGVGS
jgi:hypothetical protein